MFVKYLVNYVGMQSLVSSNSLLGIQFALSMIPRNSFNYQCYSSGGLIGMLTVVIRSDRWMRGHHGMKYSFWYVKKLSRQVIQDYGARLFNLTADANDSSKLHTLYKHPVVQGAAHWLFQWTQVLWTRPKAIIRPENQYFRCNRGLWPTAVPSVD